MLLPESCQSAAAKRDVRAERLLRMGLHGASPQEVLHHYCRRNNVHFFPVVDEEQTTVERIEGVMHGRFEFHGEAHQMGASISWQENPSVDVEWLILLHKFYYAVGLGRTFAATGDTRYYHTWQWLIDAWIRDVPLTHLTSDVMGRRVQNWVFSYYYFISSSAASDLIDAEFHARLLRSLRDQVHYLCGHLTPARNHRTIELYAIFLVAVVFPEFDESEEWLAFATRELAENIQSDLLADGVHCELSTDYHHLVLKNYLGICRLARLNSISLPAVIDQRVQQGLDFAAFVHKPDGVIPSLSDGDARSFLSLLREGYELYGDPFHLYVATAGVEGTPRSELAKWFPLGGYAVLRSGWGTDQPFADERYLVFDCGPIGAGNHGHLDALSLECAAFGKSLVVDPGRYTYSEAGDTNWRVRFRGTGYHNTIRVDGKDQTRYVAGKSRFKIEGPAPVCHLEHFLMHDATQFICGTAISDEYPVIHQRRILSALGEYWIISDFLTAQEQHSYELFFHLSAEASGCVEIQQAPCTRTLVAPNLILAQASDPRTELELQAGFVSPSYGVKHPAPVVCFSQHAANAAFHTVVMPYRNQPPTLRLELGRAFDSASDSFRRNDVRICLHIDFGTTKYTDQFHCLASVPGDALSHSAVSSDYVCRFSRHASDGRTPTEVVLRSSHSVKKPLIDPVLEVERRNLQ